MRTRIELQTMLEELVGSRNVYFQPPASMKLKYPCVVYSLKNVNTRAASNDVYKQDISYELILVDANPESEIFKKMLKVLQFKYKNHYVSENLNHYVFESYLF